MASLRTAWIEYLDLVAQRAPRTRAVVKPPAHRSDELERSLAISLPNELREWFDLHDGTGYEWVGQLVPDNFLVGIDEAIELTTMTRRIWWEADDDDGRFGRSYVESSPDRAIAGTVMRNWLPEYVYVGNDTCGGGLFVDTRAGELQGCVRYWDKTEADDDYGEGPDARSLADLVVTVRDALTSGEPIGRGQVRAMVSDGILEWVPI